MNPTSQEIRIKRQEIRIKRQEISIKRQEIRIKRQEIRIKRQEIKIKRQEIRIKRQEIKIKRQEMRIKRQEIRIKRQEMSTLFYKTPKPAPTADFINSIPKSITNCFSCQNQEIKKIRQIKVQTIRIRKSSQSSQSRFRQSPCKAFSPPRRGKGWVNPQLLQPPEKKIAGGLKPPAKIN
ncbi:MAG: hypothetical protein K1X92_11550 [Bacteroidia bacterium]|nr:hypothetical protein [Bacteroidia bacterium]